MEKNVPNHQPDDQTRYNIHHKCEICEFVQRENMAMWTWINIVVLRAKNMF